MQLEADSLEQMRSRVIAAARERIAAGEYTERGLAHRCEISQPQLHNALAKRRTRQLSIAATDRLITELHLSLPGLAEAQEAPHTATTRPAGQDGWQPDFYRVPANRVR